MAEQKKLEKLGERAEIRIGQSQEQQKSLYAEFLVDAFLQFTQAQDQFAEAASANITTESKQFPYELYSPQLEKELRQVPTNRKIKEIIEERKKEIYEQRKKEKEKFQGQRQRTLTALSRAKDYLLISTQMLKDRIKEYLPFVTNPALKPQLEAFQTLLRSYEIHTIPRLVVPSVEDIKSTSFSYEHTRKNSSGRNVLKNGKPIKNTNNRRGNISARKSRPQMIVEQNGSIRPVEHISISDLKRLLVQVLPKSQAARIVTNNNNMVEGVGELFGNNETGAAAAATTKPNCNKKEGCSIQGGKRRTLKRRHHKRRHTRRN
jgi:hypothetical protein